MNVKLDGGGKFIFPKYPCWSSQLNVKCDVCYPPSVQHEMGVGESGCLRVPLLLQLQLHLHYTTLRYTNCIRLPYTTPHYTTTTITTTTTTTLHYTTLRCTNYTTRQLQLQLHFQLRLRLQLHYITRHYPNYTTLRYTNYNYNYSYSYATLHYTTALNTTPTLHDTTFIMPHHNYNCNYTTLITLQLQLHYATTTTTAALHHTTSSSCGWGDHCNQCNHPKKHNSNHLSVHQWIFALPSMHHINSPLYSVLSLKLPPPPCAVLLVIYPHFLAVKRLNPQWHQPYWHHHCWLCSTKFTDLRGSGGGAAPPVKRLRRQGHLQRWASCHQSSDGSTEDWWVNGIYRSGKTDGLYHGFFKKSQKMMILVASIVDYITYDWKSPS